MKDALEIWRKMCLCRAFELEVVKAHKAGRIKCPVYLSVGQESIPSVVATLCPGWPIFPSHRNHSWAICCGIDPAALRDELLGLPTGCTKGMGGSASIHLPGKMFGHDGLLGSNVALSAGYAVATGRPTLAICGDGAVEEGYVLSSIGMATSKHLSILFIVEDNNLSISNTIESRRKWNIVDVARGFGLQVYDERDDFEQLYGTILQAKNFLPCLINVHVTRHFWHSGSGQDKIPNQDNYIEFKNWLKDGRLNIEPIEEQSIADMEKLWL